MKKKTQLKRLFFLGGYIFVLNSQRSELKMQYCGKTFTEFCNGSQGLVQLQRVCCKERPQKSKIMLIKHGWMTK